MPPVSRTDPFKAHFIHEAHSIGHSVFHKGAGPGVLLLHELTGFTPEFWRLAHWLSETFEVFAPDLLGRDATPTPPSDLKNTLRFCISREVHMFAKDDPGPITQWLRSLSQAVHQRCPGQGVGVIGMCMTGNFALTLALDPWVAAPVVSQPALPASLPFRDQNGGLQMSTAERDALAQRKVDVLGLRFAGDKLCRNARFDTIRGVVGKERFQEHVIDDCHRNPDGRLKFAHSVLTADLIDETGSMTRRKVDEVMAFLSERISPVPQRPEGSD